MKELEKNIMCVLLQALLDKNLITPKIFENTRNTILDTCGNTDFFYYAEEGRKEDSHGHTQNSC